MKYIEAPQKYEPADNEKTLFIAGGITGCSDWQSELTNMLKDQNITILNPRRKQFLDNPNATKEQIKWEYEYIQKANAVSFWFTKETLCPICLYELGKYSMTNKPVFVGVDPDYKRKQDVEIQTSLIRPDIKIVYSLKDFSEQIKQWINKNDSQ